MWSKCKQTISASDLWVDSSKMEDIELIKSMKVQELKDFLKLRGLKVSGKKSELVARSFVAVENKVPTVKNAEEIQEEIKNEYQHKLLFEGESFPDPMKLVDGWVNKEGGVSLWPQIPMVYIIKFLMLDNDAEDLSDYKSSKAYSYCKRGWFGEIFYHPISESTDLCIIKSDCRPSQRINDTKHKRVRGGGNSPRRETSPESDEIDSDDNRPPCSSWSRWTWQCMCSRWTWRCTCVHSTMRPLLILERLIEIMSLL